MSDPILSADGLHTHLGGKRRWFGRSTPPVRAVDGVDLDLAPGEIFGLVGESGCGKTTLGRTLLGLERETAGRIHLRGREVSGLAPVAARRARSAVQYVHQDPGAALDPWWSIGATLREALAIAGVGGADREARIDEVMEAVGLPATVKRRYAHELSGGQLRRVGLARILVLRPEVVILDEPTSGLDLSVQATVLRFFQETRERFGLTYLFISHDLAVVRLICQRVAIMYLGRIVETGTVEAVFGTPRHPYTRALMAAAPHPDPERRARVPALDGEPPSPRNIPVGCRFRNRCPHAVVRCGETDPALEETGAGHAVACLRWTEIAEATGATEERNGYVS